MIRRSRISVRPNVRPGGRPSVASSQDASKPNADLSSSQGSEQTEPVPVPEQQPPSAPTQAPSNDTQKPEPARPAQPERVPQGDVSVPETPSQKTAQDERLSQPSPSTTAPSNTDTEPLSPHTSTSLPSHTSTTSIKPFSSSRGAAKTDPLPPTTTTAAAAAASEQAKTADKAPPLRRPKTRPSLPTLPRQPRARPKEDAAKPPAPQKQDVPPSDNKGNTETQLPDVFESGPPKEAAAPPPAVTQPSDNATPSPTSDTWNQQDATELLKQKKETEITAERLKRKLAVISAAEKGKPKQPEVRSYGLKDSTDLIRLGKAKKLRELLKLEICKEKNQKTLLVKTKRIQYDTVKDPSKMTMRELIYYLPKTNPMKEISSEERVLPQSKQLTQEPAPEPEPEPRNEEEEDEEAVLSGEDVSEPLLVPQVKVAEDGTLIIDEQSLTVQVKRMEGPNPTEERDPVFERGSTTTYSSFRKGTYTKPWSSQETDMFFLAISMVGTDFSMIGSMFPHRARSEIKNKFKKEERTNAWRVDKAFRERRRLDMEFFTELLDKILAEEERRKKSNKGGQKRERRPRVRKPKKVVTADTEDSAGEDLIDLAEGEKENEDCLSDQATANRKTIKKKSGSEAADTPPKKKTTKRKKTPEADPDGGASIEVELQDEEGSGSLMKDAQASDGRRKSSRKPRSSKTVEISSDEGDGGTEETTKPSAKKKRKAEASPTSKTKKSKKGELTELKEESPSRTGRLKRKRPQPKLPAKERGTGKKDRPLTQSSDDNANVDSTGRHGKKQKRGGLVTLRASVSDDDAEGQDGEMLDAEEEEDEEGGYRATRTEDMNQVPAFVPVGLRSPVPVIAEIEETLEEAAVDFVPYENLEESAAQTLLAIGNTCHAPLRPCSSETVADEEQTGGLHVSGTDADTARPSQSGDTVGQQLHQGSSAIAPSGPQEEEGQTIEESGYTISEEALEEEPPSAEIEEEPPTPAVEEDDEQPSATDVDTEAAAVPLESETSLCGISSIGDHLEQGAADVSGPSDPQAEDHPTAVDTEDAPLTLSGISLIEEHLQQEDVSLSQLTEALREEPMYLMSDEPTNELPSSADDLATEGPSSTEDASEFPSCIDEQVNELLSCAEPANQLPSCSGAGSVEAAVAIEAGNSLCSMASIAEHFTQGAASVTQLSDPNSDEPIFIISLTEISPSFIESLPTDADPPLSHTQLLMCDPQPLSAQPQALASTSSSSSSTTNTFPLATTAVESLAQATAVVPEPVAAPTEPCPMTSQWSRARDVNTGGVQQANVKSEHRTTRTEEDVEGNSAWGAPAVDGDTRTVSHVVFTDALVAVEAEGEKDGQREEVPTTAGSSSENVVGSVQPGVSGPTEEEPPPAKKTVTRRAKVQVKPALTGRRNVSQKASEETKSTPPSSSSSSSTSSTQTTLSKASPQSSSIQPSSVTSSVATPGVQVQFSSNQLPAASSALMGRRNVRKKDSSEETSPPPCSSTRPVTSKTWPAASHQPSSITSGVCTEDAPVVQTGVWEAPDHSSTVSHMIVTDFLVPVEEEMEKRGEKDEMTTTASSSTGNVVGSAHFGVEVTAATKKATTRRAKVQVKPALTGRRNLSQKASEETKSTPPASTTSSTSASTTTTTQATVSKVSVQFSSNQLPAASSAMTGSRNVREKDSEETSPPPPCSSTQPVTSKTSPPASHHQPSSTASGVCAEDAPVVPYEAPDHSSTVSRMIVTDFLVPVKEETATHSSTENVVGSPQPDLPDPTEEEPIPAKKAVTRRAKVQVKPALAGRRNVPKTTSEESSTPSTSSTQPVANTAATGSWSTKQSDGRAAANVEEDTTTVSHMIVTDFLVPVEADVEKHESIEETSDAASYTASTENVSAQPGVSRPTEEEAPPSKKAVTRSAKVQVKPALTGRRNVSQKASEETKSTPPSSSTSSTQATVSKASPQSSSIQPPSVASSVETAETPVGRVQTVPDHSVAREWRRPVHDDSSAVSHMIVTDFLVPVEAESEKHGESEKTPGTAIPTAGSNQSVVSGPTEEEPAPAKKTTTTRRAKVQVKPALTGRRNVFQNTSEEKPSTSAAVQSTPSIAEDSIISDRRYSVDTEDSATVSHMIVTDFLVPVEADVEKHESIKEAHPSARSTTDNVVRSEQPGVSSPTEEEPAPVKTAVTRRVVSAQPDVSGPTEEEPTPAKKTVTRRAKVQVKPALTGRQKVSQKPPEELSTSAAVQSTPSIAEDPIISDLTASVDVDDATPVSHTILSDASLVPVEAEMKKRVEPEEAHSSASSSTEKIPARTAATRRAKIQVKPVTAARGTISKSASAEPSPSPLSASTPQPVVTIVASTASSSEPLPSTASPQPPSTTDDAHAEEEETPAVRSTPQAPPPNPLSRPGRKLKGFLSFMSSSASTTSGSGSGPGPGATRPAQPRAAAVPTTRPCSRPRPAPAPGPRTKTAASSSSAPSSSSSSSVAATTDASISRSSSSHTSTTDRVVPTMTCTRDFTDRVVPTMTSTTHGTTKTAAASTSMHGPTKTAVASTLSRDGTKTAVPSTSSQSSSKTAVPTTSSHGSRKAAPVISSGSTTSSVDCPDSREVSISQQSEEPTGISAFILSDIFTEVAEDP